MNPSCFLQPTCLANAGRHRSILVQLCERITPRSQRRPPPSKLSCLLGSRLSFSTSERLSLPRKPPRATSNRAVNYPGFRNESKEHRRVREHNLFNPPSPDASYDHLITRDIVRKFPTPSSKSTLKVSETSIADLEREIIWLAARLPPGPRLLNTLDHLIIDRRRQPNVLHYEALILANASPDDGSAENVRSLIQEMEDYKVPRDSNIYTAILRTMVIHPDAEIVADVIESCSRMWIELDLEMLHLISAAYLRAGMPELALDYLKQVEKAAQSSGSKIELWLYVLFIRHLALEGDWDGVIRMCYRVSDDLSLGIPLAMRQIDVPYDFWHWLLEHAAAAGDQWVTYWIWKTWVLRTWIRPRPRLCVRVLEIAAENGLVSVAESVLTVLNHLRRSDRAQDDDPETGISWGEDREEVRKLLAQAHANAPESAREVIPQEKRLVGAQWWMFKDRTGARKELSGKLRFDPWAVLNDETDPGRAWPRILQERVMGESGNREWRRNAAAGQRRKVAELAQEHNRGSANYNAEVPPAGTKLAGQQECAKDVENRDGLDKDPTNTGMLRAETGSDIYHVPIPYKKRGFVRLSTGNTSESSETG